MDKIYTGLNKNIYLDNGYLNIKKMYKTKCPFIWLIGGRGCGKTYGVLSFVINDLKQKFIYMRRTGKQLELSTLPKLSPFKKINDDFGRKIEPIVEKDMIYFLENNIEVAFGASLSTFYNLRSVSLDEYNFLYFDEIIPEIMEKVRRGEGRALEDAIETINRNRELDGKPPIICFFSGNSDTLNSDILRVFGIIDIVEDMVKTGKEIYINRETGHAVYNLYKSPITAEKSETALYKATKDKIFYDRSINNTFVDLRDSKDIKNISLLECVPLANINNEICLYRHKSNDTNFVCKKLNRGVKNYNINNSADRKTFLRMYGEYLRSSIDYETIYFDCFSTKSILLDILYA